jgi:hypothetical protein
VKRIEVQGHVREVPTEARSCAICSAAFQGAGRQRYCGKACERRAYYERHADAVKAKRRARYRDQKEAKRGLTRGE